MAPAAARNCPQEAYERLLRDLLASVVSGCDAEAFGPCVAYVGFYFVQRVALAKHEAVAGMDPTNIVRLNMYTTDVDGFMRTGRGGVRI